MRVGALLVVLAVHPRGRPCPSHHTEQYGEGMSTDPLVKTGRALSAAETTRYARHVLLPEVGRDGQERLKAARVLVVGAGGLGSPALLYLAAAGVGTIGVVDADVVDLTNLHRQVIHSDADIGRPKTESARDRRAPGQPARQRRASRPRARLVQRARDHRPTTTSSSTAPTTSRRATSSTTRASCSANRTCGARSAVRRAGLGVVHRPRPLLPLRLPRATPARVGAELRRGWGARRAVRGHRLGPVHRGDQAAPRHR